MRIDEHARIQILKMNVESLMEEYRGSWTLEEVLYNLQTREVQK